MFTEMMMSAGGGGSATNKVIFADALGQGTNLLQMYDTDYFNYTSGSFRTTIYETSLISFTAKFTGDIGIAFGYRSEASLKINGANVLPAQSTLIQNIHINSGDTIEWNSPPYYNDILIFLNLDNSTWTK